MSEPVRYIIIAIVAYLLGSISTGLILARAKNGPDLHKVGSGSTGASNVQRTMGNKSGFITFFGDFGKAALACGLGWWIAGCREGAMLAGLFVVLGHNWPVFFGFKGGKGVASSTAVMLVCYPIPALICYAIAIAVIAIWRYISVGSMVLLVSYAVLVSTIWNPGYQWLPIAWSVLLAVICVARHHANIRRLARGEENKLSFKKKEKQEQTSSEDHQA